MYQKIYTYTHIVECLLGKLENLEKNNRKFEKELEEKYKFKEGIFNQSLSEELSKFNQKIKQIQLEKIILNE